MDMAEDDGHTRTGNVWTATTHIVTAVIGSAVLALPWSVAQLGWIIGTFALLAFSGITCYTSTFLANSYRSPISGARNRTYMDAVRSYLGPREVFMCLIAQYLNLWGTMVGYTVIVSTSMIAVKRSNCFHRHGLGANCDASGTMVTIVFGLIQVVLSQFPSLENITCLSVVAAVMSFVYSFIALGICIAKWASVGEFRGNLTGVHGLSPSSKTWSEFLALGNIACAYAAAEVLVEIQDTLKSPPPESNTMKKAALYGIGLTTIFNLTLGCIGYAAFGEEAPGNLLTDFGLHVPFWILDVGNLSLIIHLAGAYQVYAQPIFGLFESWMSSRWPEAVFVHKTYTIRLPLGGPRSFSFTLSKIVLRSAFVAVTTFVAMLLPFFNAVLGLLGALGFWPLTVYFPVSIHIAQAGVRRGMPKWVLLQCLSAFCFLISVAAGIGSVVDIVDSIRGATPFKTLG